MRSLLIGKAEEEQARQIMAYARNYKERFIDLVRRQNKPEASPGNNPNLVLRLFDGWKVVYTIEEQPDPLGWVVHLSVSVQARHKKEFWPHPRAIDAGILPLFNLKITDAVFVYREVFKPPIEGVIAGAVNLLFKFKK